MTEDELGDGITPDHLRGVFLYGCHRLRFNDNGLAPGLNDPDDVRAVGTCAVLVNRYTEQGDTVFDGTIGGLAVLAAALIAADESGLPVPHLVGKWHKTLATANQLQNTGNR